MPGGDLALHIAALIRLVRRLLTADTTIKPALLEVTADPAVAAVPESRPWSLSLSTMAPFGPMASPTDPRTKPLEVPRVTCPLDTLHPLRPDAGLDCAFADPDDDDSDSFVLLSYSRFALGPHNVRFLLPTPC